jgi:hypothetical protein
MDRGRVGGERGSKEMDVCPLTVSLCLQDDSPSFHVPTSPTAGI